MTLSEPPRLALALLNWFVADDEPLVGDLVETFAAHQSRLWFWRQVLFAIVIYSLRRPNVEQPLGLARRGSFTPAEPQRQSMPRQINLAASPLPHVGGLGLVAFGVLVWLAGPRMLWIFLPAMLGGVALGLVMAILRRRAALSTPPPSGRVLLHLPDGASDLK